MTDEYGYPTEAALSKIRRFKSGDNLPEFIEFLESIWWMPDWGFSKLDNILELHTGGWSGNESIVYELAETEFWNLLTVEKKGGHYWFDLDKYTQP